MQDEHVKSQFLKMVARRSAEVENQKRAKKMAEDIVTNNKSKTNEDVQSIDPDDYEEIHSKEIREMNDDVANAQLPGDEVVFVKTVYLPVGPVTEDPANQLQNEVYTDIESEDPSDKDGAELVLPK